MFAPWINIETTRPVIKNGSYIASIVKTASEVASLPCVVEAGKVVGIDNRYWCGSCESYSINFDTMACECCGYQI